MSSSICFMPGTDSSPHCGPSDIRMKCSDMYAPSAAFSAKPRTKFGDTPIHCGVKFRVAEAPRMPPASVGRPASTMISQPSPCNWLIWAVKSVSPPLNVASDVSVMPFCSLAYSRPASAVSP